MVFGLRLDQKKFASGSQTMRPRRLVLFAGSGFSISVYRAAAISS
jgi:hypothetical protein